MMTQAVGAVLSGQATAVLAFRALNGRSGARFGRSGSGARPRVGGGGTYHEFFAPYGLLAPGHLFSLIARRHMIEFGTTEEHLGHIALACRARANANPAAQMADRTLTMEEYLAGRVISSPLKLFDYCLETDGACAVIVTGTERAGDGPHPPALIRAVAQGSVPDMQPGLLFPTLMRESLTTQTSAPVAETLYRRAGLGPEEIDVAQFYDCFTITVLLQLEDYGFCAKGEGGPFAASGALDKGGRLPVNTSGGHLSEGLHGMNHVVEGVPASRSGRRKLSPWSLTDQLLNSHHDADAITIAGPPSYCVERLGKIAPLGISKFIFVGYSFEMDPDEARASRRRIAQEGLPALR